MIRRYLALAAVVSAVVPGVYPVYVHRVEGATSDRFDIVVVEDQHGERWVVRAPLDHAAGAQHEAAAALLPHVAAYLPYAVPVPVGGVRQRDRSLALVYPWVSGYVLSLTALPAGRGLATHLGECLAHIHNVPLSIVTQFDVPQLLALDCRDRALHSLDRLAATGCIPPHLVNTWEDRLTSAHLWQFLPTLVHGHVTDGHLLTEFSDADDATTGRISGILGWNQVHVADPAEDLAHIASGATPQAFDSVLESYAMHRVGDVDPALPERAALLAELTLGHAYAAAVAGGDRLEKRRLAMALRHVEDRYHTVDTSPVTHQWPPVTQTAPAPSTAPPPHDATVAVYDEPTEDEASSPPVATTVNSHVPVRTVHNMVETPSNLTDTDTGTETSDAIEIDHHSAAPTIPVPPRTLNGETTLDGRASDNVQAAHQVQASAAVGATVDGHTTEDAQATPELLAGERLDGEQGDDEHGRELPGAIASSTEAPATEAPVIEAPVANAPVTNAHGTNAPATEAHVTQAPVTEAPPTEPPATEAITTVELRTAPHTSPASIMRTSDDSDAVVLPQEARSSLEDSAIHPPASRRIIPVGAANPPAASFAPTEEQPNSAGPSSSAQPLPAEVVSEVSVQWQQRKIRRRDRAEHRRRTHARRLAPSESGSEDSDLSN